MQCLCLFVFRCYYRKGSVIADMELTFNQEVGSSEIKALLSEVTKDGKLGDLEVSQVITDGFIKGQLLFTSNIFQPRIRNIIKFSTSDNAILAFWLVHQISVTSHYTCVWPYMEMNAANVDRQRIFRGKPSFVDKKNWWKKQIRWAIHRRNTKTYGQGRPRNNKKSRKVRDEII